MTEKLPTKKKPIVLFAIQRKADGKYSRGGTPPKWGQFPKTWGIGPFKNHLIQFVPDRYWRRDVPWPYVGCEVLEIDPDNLQITKRYTASEWVWVNCYLPYRDKDGYRYNREEFMKSFEDWKKEYLSGN